VPSGKIHDAITIILTVPIVIIAFAYFASGMAALVVGAAFIFGGLMFGPDLDTVSRPYSRWGPARAIWIPYRHFFPHRSRFSHGLFLGALIRVVYLLGALTLLLMAGAYLYQAVAGGRLPGLGDIARFWTPVGQRFGTEIMLMIFIGLWAGAASHTFTDMAGSFIKTGRSGKFF
jgi:uncharacterized metal-binding protein